MPWLSWPTIWGRRRKGWQALVIEWDDGPHAKLSTKDIVDELEHATLNPGVVAETIGDVSGAMVKAVTKVEAIYQVPFLAHATMEPMNCTVHVRQDGCEIWVGTQALARAQAAAAKTAGLPLDKIVVHNHLIGGGFGRRLDVDGVVRAVQIAQQVTVRSRSCGRARRMSSTTCTVRIGSTGCRPGSMPRASRSPGAIALRVLRSWRAGPRRSSTTVSTPTQPKAQLTWSMPAKQAR
jgi:CO/xanthine dehydrogenase Mo-binding subunit